MKLRRLFIALLALPLAFAACEKQPAPEPTPEPTPTTEVVLAKSTIEATAEGGRYEVSYTIKNPVEGHNLFVAKSSDYAWISDFGAEDGIIYVVVEANETDNAREAVVEVSYGEKHSNENFKALTIKQAAKAEEPEDGVVFEAQVLTGEYYGDYYTPDAGNYYIFFSDYGFSEDGNLLTNSIYYQLDLYGVLYEGEAVNGYIPLPEGTYTLDVNDTMAVGTIGYSYSGYMKTNSSEIEVEVSFDAAELVVAADGSCVLTATIQGEKHTVTFSGMSTISDKREVSGGSGEDQNMVASYAYAYYYGDQYTPGTADNFYFFLSDLGLDADGWELPNATYYRFDLYSELVNTENGLALPYGTYTIDNGSYDPYTIGAMYSGYYVMDSEGWDYAITGTITSGTVVVDENGVTAHIMVDGAWHTVTYTGAIEVIDAASGGGGDDDYEGPYSTLWEDYRCNFDDHTLYYAYYGDYYEVGYMNWTFAVMPNDGEGDFVQFDVLAGANSTTEFFGEYAINDSFEAYTSYPGYIDGYMVGAWYYTEDGYTMAPFVDGTMSVEDNGDGTVTVEFDVYDDCDNNITGSWTGAMLSADELSTRAADIKKAEVKSVKAPVKRAIEVKKRDISKF